MEDILVAILKGGELIVDLAASVYERFLSDGDEDEDADERDRTDGSQ